MGIGKKVNTGRKGVEAVRERILAACEELFARQGFERTSVRDITRLAQCNIAAINYHFGGKDNLYVELFRRNLHWMRDARIEVIKGVMEGASVSLERLIREFAKAHMETIVGQKRGANFAQLAMREMLEPHLPRNMILDDYVRPVSGVFSEALIKLEPKLEAKSAELCIHWIIAQLYHVFQVRNLYGKSSDEPILDERLVIEHIVNFSTGGVRASIAKKGKI